MSKARDLSKLLNSDSAIAATALNWTVNDPADWVGGQPNVDIFNNNGKYIPTESLESGSNVSLTDGEDSEIIINATVPAYTAASDGGIVIADAVDEFGVETGDKTIAIASNLSNSGINKIGPDLSNYIHLSQSAMYISRTKPADINEGTLEDVEVGHEVLRMDQDGNLELRGNVTAFSAMSEASDRRLKTDIEPVTNGLEIIEKLNGYRFTFSHNGLDSAGVMADEVEAVIPSAVRQSKLMAMDDDVEYSIVSYSQFHAFLIEAVKELSVRVKELENDNR